jgi:hypothetical protein
VLVFVQEAIEREDAAFAVVLGAQHEERIFDGDDEDDGPDRKRDRTEHIVGRWRNAGRAEEDLINGVER